MTDSDFLELFHKIDDKYLEEAQRDQHRRHFSRQRIFNTLSTMAACMAIVIAAVLLVSSFISSGQFVMSNPNSPEASSDPLNAASSPTVNIEPTPAPALSSNSTLSFPIHHAELDLPKEDQYNAFYATVPVTVTAVLDFSVHLSDNSLDTRIPSRLYVFADGQPISFQYKSSESIFRDFTIVPDAYYSLPLYFEASQDVNAISVVCVFFPGDSERQSCLIHSAGNIFGTQEILDTFIDNSYFTETDSEMTANFVTVISDPHKIPKNGIAYGEELNIPADSAYLTVSLGVPYKTEFSGDYEESLDINPHYIIALVNGKPVSVFENDELLCLDGFYNSNKGLLYQYKIPEECLPENSTLQIISLPAAVTSWRDTDYSSDCFRIV